MFPHPRLRERKRFADVGQFAPVPSPRPRLPTNRSPQLQKPPIRRPRPALIPDGGDEDPVLLRKPHPMLRFKRLHGFFADYAVDAHALIGQQFYRTGKGLNIRSIDRRMALSSRNIPVQVRRPQQKGFAAPCPPEPAFKREPGRSITWVEARSLTAQLQLRSCGKMHTTRTRATPRFTFLKVRQISRPYSTMAAE